MKRRKFLDGVGGFLRRISGKPERPDLGEVGSDGEGDKAEKNESGIVSFTYRYIGSIGGNSFKYELKDGRLIVDLMEYRDYGELSDKIPAGFADRLKALCDSCRIYRWNGFDKSNRLVLDGSGFSLSIRFADGKTLHADGSNSFPGGYREFRERLDALFAPEKEKLLEIARLKQIEKGVTGSPRLILACFKQKGASGGDDYHILFSKNGVRSSNFELKVKSESGEFFPRGEISYYTSLPDEMMRLDEFGEIVKKHGVINWLDFDKSSQDPNNSEWFQLSLSYDDGRINARGTEHPENYDGFRRDFLSLVADITENAREKGFLKEDS